MSFTHKAGASLRFEQGSWQEIVHDIYMGVMVTVGHMSYYFMSSYQFLFPSSIDDDKSLEDVPNLQGMKVVGVGFGRTGTYSVKLALDELGYPTLHTQHLYEVENERIFKGWTQDIFRPSMNEGHALMGTPDFELITQQGYAATMDFPFALYYEQVLEQYPDCKFILTKRDSSEIWFRSWDTLTKSISTPVHLFGSFMPSLQRYSIYLRWLFAVVNKNDSYLTARIPQVNQYKEAAIDSYEAHNQRVKEVVPPGQLLEYSVKQGWEPLCNFLEIQDCPTTPFPKTNSARSLRVQSVASTILPLACILFVLFFAFAQAFQRLTGKTVLQWMHVQSRKVPHALSKTMVGDKRYQAAKYGKEA